MGTTPRSIRVDESDLDLAAQLQQHRPSYLHEKDILAVAIKRGLRVMAAEATLPGDGQYGGLDPAALARELRQLLLPVFDFLANQNEIPSWMFPQPVHVHAPVIPEAGQEPVASEDVAQHNYQAATHDLSGMMMSLEDDDEDDD